jgi:hypothetical protein
LKSKLIKLLENQTVLFTWALLIKLMLTGLSLTDCLGALAILSAILLAKVVSNKYPKQPDLYQEMAVMQMHIDQLIKDYESVESDLTSLKFGLNHKR